MKAMLVAAAFVGGSGVASADTFTYILEQFNTSQTECEQAAGAVLEAFGSRTGRETTGVECVLTRQGIYKLVLAYDGEEAVTVTSNLPGDLTDKRKPLYDDLSSCRSALEDEASLLLAETGLPLLSAYCQHVPQNLDIKYAPKVDVLGDGVVQGQIAGFPLPGLIHSFAPTNLGERFAARDVSVIQVYETVASSVERIVNIRYYNGEELGLAWTGPLGIDVIDFSACEEAQQAVAEAFANSSLWYLTATCSSATRAASPAELRVIHGRDPYINHLRSLESFDSLPECQEARDRLVARQQEIASDDAVGFCVREGRRVGYRVHLVVK